MDKFEVTFPSLFGTTQRTYTVSACDSPAAVAVAHDLLSASVHGNLFLTVPTSVVRVHGTSRTTMHLI